MKQINLAAIGLGNRSEILESAHSPQEGIRVTTGIDVSERARSEFLDRFPGAQVWSDYRQLLQEPGPDAVFVLSPDYLHKEQACALLGAGIPVFLEKPIATTVADADAILNTARTTGTKLFLGHNMRYFPCILKMKEVIDSGSIGRIEAVWVRHFVAYGGDAYFRDWHSESRYSTGLLLQKAAHDIDIIHWLAGSYTRKVVAMGKLSVYDRLPRRKPAEPGDATFRTEHWPPEEQSGFSPTIDVEDHSMVLMQLANGVQASYTQCHYTPDAHRNYTFIGTRGRVENIGDHGRCRIAVYTSRHDDQAQPDVVHDIETGDDEHGGADPVMIRSFLDYLLDRDKPNTSPIAAREAVATGCTATESLRTDSCARIVPEPSEENRRYFR